MSQTSRRKQSTQVVERRVGMKLQKAPDAAHANGRQLPILGKPFLYQSHQRWESLSQAPF
jgi:hypothetical protein